MIRVNRKTILVGASPKIIENMKEDEKMDLEDIISTTKSFFNFTDYINIYFDNKIISIQWRGKSDSVNITDIEKSYKDKIDSFIKKMYNL